MILKLLLRPFIFCIFLGVIFITSIITYFSNSLPDYWQLEDYVPPTVTRLYDENGDVIAEYSYEKRIFMPLNEIPKVVIDAFLAAEDKNFFTHPGVDFASIIRAAVQNLINIKSNKRIVGGSTITQQVVKDFFLSNERTLDRKIKEAILSYRISNIYSKNRILEIYLNQIYLGNSSYGVASAAQNYFNKNIEDLNIAEAAMLAALPKAPTSLNPFLNYDRAKARRDWVINRMLENEFISYTQAIEAIGQSIELYNADEDNTKKYCNSYAEVVRQMLIKKYGEDTVYRDGLIVNTYIDETLQAYAVKAFKEGLENYDKQRGWRGPISKINLRKENWSQRLSEINKTIDNNEFKVAVILKSYKNSADIGFANNTKGTISNLAWIKNNILKEGDVVLVKHIEKQKYSLEQIPNFNGGMVVLQPYTGKVLAIVGGYNNSCSEFNRVTQAKRQPGSVFKPIVYLTALENGFSPESNILDEPINVDTGISIWSPKNYQPDFLGNITLTTALARSRNLPTVRLILELGANKIMNTAIRLGIYDDDSYPAYNSMALGTVETTLLKMANAFNIIASDGYYTEPKTIDSIYDRRGRVLYYDSSVTCNGCTNYIHDLNEVTLPIANYFRERLVNKRHNKEITEMLKQVVTLGSGARALVLNKQVAGKTGTTNNSFDTWFIGFSADFTVGIYVGFDLPRTLGRNAYGANVALPIFVNFMKEALKGLSDKDIPFQRDYVKIIDIGDDGSNQFSGAQSIDDIISKLEEEYNN